MKIAGIEFDRVVTTAVDFDATPEGHHTRYGPDGSLVGLTIVNARWWLEKDGEIAITLAEQKVRATDIGAVLAAA
ncbi:MAG TPA: hypothetical protein VH063_13475 [Gaiellaceae bacterium]|nr:hypothetical protein [Gaiellaceae bacterium]